MIDDRDHRQTGRFPERVNPDVSAPQAHSDSERDVRELLASAAAVPRPDAAFEETVRDRSLVEYDQKFPPAKPQRRSLASRLSMLVTASALALVCFVAVWPSGPAFSFETMRSAILERPVMRLFGQSEGAGVIGWYRPGQTHRGGGSLAAVEADGRVYWAVGADRRSVGYDVRDATLISEAEPAPSRLLAVMALIDGGGANDRVESFSLTSRDGVERGKLTVRSGPHEVVFNVRMDTGLPISVSYGREQSFGVEFRNEREGPVSLAAMGVPGPIIAAASRGGLRPSALLAGDAVRTRFDELPQTAMGTQDRLGLSSLPDREPKLAKARSEERTVLGAYERPLRSKLFWKHSAAESVPIDWGAMVNRIDSRFQELWSHAGVSSAGPASWHELHRRLSLDLIGRPPTVEEIRRREGWPAEEIVDELIASEEFSLNLADVWTNLLLPASVSLLPVGGEAAFSSWLAEEFANESGYDALVRKLLLADVSSQEPRPAVFYAAFSGDSNQIVKQTSRVFLGTQLDCAQCHDHPFDDWTTSDFEAFATFFSQAPETSVARTEAMESRPGHASDSHDEARTERQQFADLQWLSSDDLLSRRETLAAWITSRENRQFARSTVNHVWEYLFGRGLVAPTDDIGPHNPSLDDVLLDELAESFAANGFDITTLIRSLVSTDVYQQSSRSDGDVDAQDQLFAKRYVRRLRESSVRDALLGIAQQFSANSEGVERRLIELQRIALSEATQREKIAATALDLIALTTTDRQETQEDLLRLHRFSSQALVDVRAETAEAAGEVLEQIYLACVSRPPTKSERTRFFAGLQDTSKETFAASLAVLCERLIRSEEFVTNR